MNDENKVRNDFQYILNYDYETDFGDDFYLIKNIRINKEYKIINRFIKSFTHYLTKTENRKKYKIENSCEFVDYCVNRLVKIYKVYEMNMDDWHFEMQNAYYGQEIISVRYEKFERFTEDIKKIISFEDPNKRINYILEKEYGYLLDCLKNKKYKEEKVDVSSIRIGNNNYLRKVDCDFKNYYKNDDLPIGIYLKQEDKTYRIIDGYHRYVMNNNQKKVKIIIAYD
jgi:hypothetical protein